MPPKKSSPRYLFIDALRGIAALLVVGYHAREGEHLTELTPQLPRFVDAVLEHGHTGVAMFFTISGFVIANTLTSQDVTPRYAGTFMLRRSLRLDPPYWASMVLTVALAALSARVMHKAYELPSASLVFWHVLYLQELLRLDAIGSVYWTLTLEIQFYLSFVLLLMFVRVLARRLGKRRALDFVLYPSVLFSNLWALGLAPFQVYGLFLGQWYMFLAGVLVWRALHAQAGERLPVIAAVLDIVLLGAAAMYFHDVTIGIGALTAATVLAVGLAGRLTSLLGARPFQFLGGISYSLYLIHAPLTGAGFRLGFMLTGRGAALEALWLVLVTAGCVLAAYLFFLAVEKPSMELAKRIGQSPTPEPVLDAQTP